MTRTPQESHQSSQEGTAEGARGETVLSLELHLNLKDSLKSISIQRDLSI